MTEHKTKTMPVESIEIGDTVHHEPSGDDWIVARVTKEHIWPCGWPPGRANIADCKLIEKATPEQREDLLIRLRKLPENDERHIEAAAPSQPSHNDDWKLQVFDAMCDVGLIQFGDNPENRVYSVWGFSCWHHDEDIFKAIAAAKESVSLPVVEPIQPAERSDTADAVAALPYYTDPSEIALMLSAGVVFIRREDAIRVAGAGQPAEPDELERLERFCEWKQTYPLESDAWLQWYQSDCGESGVRLDDLSLWNYCPNCGGKVRIKDHECAM